MGFEKKLDSSLALDKTFNTAVYSSLKEFYLYVSLLHWEIIEYVWLLFCSKSFSLSDLIFSVFNLIFKKKIRKLSKA